MVYEYSLYFMIICTITLLFRVFRIENKEFTDILIKLETAPECHGYSLQSFLTLPMQRVTRLPLLLQAIQRRLDIGTEEFSSCRAALSSLNQVRINLFNINIDLF